MVKTEDAHPPHLRFNFAMGLIHGILFRAGTAFSEPMSVLPIFLEHFTSSRTMIGVFSALISGGVIGYKNYLLEIAPEPSRPAYLSLDGTLSGATMFLPVLG